jgi:hypothetical protein
LRASCWRKRLFFIYDLLRDKEPSTPQNACVLQSSGSMQRICSTPCVCVRAYLEVRMIDYLIVLWTAERDAAHRALVELDVDVEHYQAPLEDRLDYAVYVLARLLEVKYGVDSDDIWF